MTDDIETAERNVGGPNDPDTVTTHLDFANDLATELAPLMDTVH